MLFAIAAAAVAFSSNVDPALHLNFLPPDKRAGGILRVEATVEPKWRLLFAEVSCRAFDKKSKLIATASLRWDGVPIATQAPAFVDLPGRSVRVVCEQGVLKWNAQ